MRRGEPVVYVDASGGRHSATVTAFVGSGPTGLKVVDVAYEGGSATGVPHVADEKGSGYWHFPEEPEVETKADRSVPRISLPPDPVEGEHVTWALGQHEDAEPSHGTS